MPLPDAPSDENADMLMEGAAGASRDGACCCCGRPPPNPPPPVAPASGEGWNSPLVAPPPSFPPAPKVLNMDASDFDASLSAPIVCAAAWLMASEERSTPAPPMMLDRSATCASGMRCAKLPRGVSPFSIPTANSPAVPSSCSPLKCCCCKSPGPPPPEREVEKPPPAPPGPTPEGEGGEEGERGRQAIVNADSASTSEDDGTVLQIIRKHWYRSPCDLQVHHSTHIYETQHL